MLPGGPLAKKQLTKLKIYNGDNHPHENQKPKIIDFSKLKQKKFSKKLMNNLNTPQISIKKLNLILKTVSMQLVEEKDQLQKYGLKKGQEIFM